MTQRVVLCEEGGDRKVTTTTAGTTELLDVALRDSSGNIIEGVQTSFSHGQKGSIETSAVQMTTSSIVAQRGVLVKAATGNEGTVYVGNSNGVTASTGFELIAGESVVVPVNNANLVYLVADRSNQKVFYIVC